MSGQHELRISVGLLCVPCSHSPEKAQGLHYGTTSKGLHFTNGTEAMIPLRCQYGLQTGQKYICVSGLSSITNLSSITVICNIAWSTV